MEWLLIVVFAALIVAGAVVFTRGRARDRARVGPGGTRAIGTSAGSPRRAPAASVRTLKPGDVVFYDGADFIVEGTLRLEEGGFQWQEHRLVAGERSLWLSVEDDEGLEVVAWERGHQLDLVPGAESLEHQGIAYELEERGSARFVAEGSTGTGTAGEVEYVDYAAGDRRLGFERFGSATHWEVGAGQVVSEHAFDVYPGRGLEP
jgi:hypothetical protein